MLNLRNIASKPLMILPGVWLSAIAALAAQSGPSISLDLGVVMETAAIGAKVAMPVTLVTNSEETKVERVTLQMSFPAKGLTFREATKGTALLSIDASIDAEVKDSENGEKILQLEVSAPGAMPQGTLVYLSFEIGHDIEPDTEIRMKNLKQSAQAVDGKALDTYGIDGSITVLTPAAPCFFYMH